MKVSSYLFRNSDEFGLYLLFDTSNWRNGLWIAEVNGLNVDMQQCRFLQIFSKRLVMKMDRRQRQRRPTLVITYNDITVVSFTIDPLSPYIYPWYYTPFDIAVTPRLNAVRLLTTRDDVDVSLPFPSLFYYFSDNFFQFLRYTVAKCDRPLYDLLAARNCQGSLYDGLTSCKKTWPHCIAYN